MPEHDEAPSPPQEKKYSGGVILTVALAGLSALTLAMVARTGQILGWRDAGPFSLWAWYSIPLLLLWIFSHRRAARAAVRWMAICCGIAMVFLYNWGLMDFIRSYYGSRCGNSLIEPLAFSFLLSVAFAIAMAVIRKSGG